MASRSGSRGFTLVELLVVVVALLVVVALGLPAFGRIHRQELVEACAGHLRAMHGAAQTYNLQAGAAARKAELGSSYWGALAKTTPPLVAPETLRCPLNTDDPPLEIQYLGPVADPRQMEKDDPIGCDLAWNHSANGHEGGNILLRSGGVVNDNPQHQEGLWMTRIRVTCGK